MLAGGLSYSGGYHQNTFHGGYNDIGGHGHGHGGAISTSSITTHHIPSQKSHYGGNGASVYQNSFLGQGHEYGYQVGYGRGGGGGYGHHDDDHYHQNVSVSFINIKCRINHILILITYQIIF